MFAKWLHNRDRRTEELVVQYSSLIFSFFSRFLSPLLSESVSLPGWFVRVLMHMCLFSLYRGTEPWAANFSIHWENMLVEEWKKGSSETDSGPTDTRTLLLQINHYNYWTSSRRNKQLIIVLLLFHDCKLHMAGKWPGRLQFKKNFFQWNMESLLEFVKHCVTECVWRKGSVIYFHAVRGSKEMENSGWLSKIPKYPKPKTTAVVECCSTTTMSYTAEKNNRNIHQRHKVSRFILCDKITTNRRLRWDTDFPETDIARKHSKGYLKMNKEKYIHSITIEVQSIITFIQQQLFNLHLCRL